MTTQILDEIRMLGVVGMVGFHSTRSIVLERRQRAAALSLLDTKPKFEIFSLKPTIPTIESGNAGEDRDLGMVGSLRRPSIPTSQATILTYGEASDV